MSLDSRLFFHVCYAILAMLIYMLPHVDPIEMLFKTSKVLLGLKCPINRPPCAFLMSDALKEP